MFLRLRKSAAVSCKGAFQTLETQSNKQTNKNLEFLIISLESGKSLLYVFTLWSSFIVLMHLPHQASMIHAHAAPSPAHSGEHCSSSGLVSGGVLEQLSLGDVGEAKRCAREHEQWKDNSHVLWREKVFVCTMGPTFSGVRSFQLPRSFKRQKTQKSVSKF